MKKLLTRTIPALIFLSVSLLAVDVKACSCGPRPSIYQMYRAAPAVFVGKVIATKDVVTNETINGREYPVTERLFQFSVTELFKGVKGSQVWINLGRIDSSCYSGFTLGESYLVFAGGESEETLRTGLCSGTNNLWSAADDLHFIRELLKGVPESRVYGSVMRHETIVDGSTASPRATPMEGIKVLIEGKDKQFEAVTDKNGIFRIEKIPDGRYKAHPVLPDRYMVYFPTEEEFFLGTSDEWFHTRIDRGATAHMSFMIGWNNGLKGRIVDSEGNSVSRARVSVLANRDSGPVVIRGDDYNSGLEEKFRFSGLTPGRYFLSVDIRAPFDDKKRPTRFYYPNASALDQAEEIRLGESDTLDERDIRLPPEYVVREIKGVVVWPNGVPVSDAWVFLAASKDSADDESKYDWKSTDQLGRFSLQAFVGAEYWVHAESRESGKGEPIKVKIEKINETLKVVIPFPKRIEP